MFRKDKCVGNLTVQSTVIVYWQEMRLICSTWGAVSSANIIGCYIDKKKKKSKLIPVTTYSSSYCKNKNNNKYKCICFVTSYCSGNYAIKNIVSVFILLMSSVPYQERSRYIIIIMSRGVNNIFIFIFLRGREGEELEYY